MHIWIDGQCFQTASRTRGIGRYVQELMQAMLEGDGDLRISVSFNATLSDSAIVAREVLAGLVDPADIHVWEGPTTSVEIVEGYSVERRLGELALAHHVNCIAPDVALSVSPFEGINDPTIPFLPSDVLQMPQACIFYDAIPFRFADRYLDHPGLRSAYMRRLDALAGFDLALCISDFSRRECLDIHPGLSAVNISAGIARRLRELIDQPSDYRSPARAALGDGYTLYVGANDWRKNVRTVVEALGELPHEVVREHPLVLIGPSDETHYKRDRTIWSLAGLPGDALVNLGKVSDEELIELYRGAAVLVQPSLMEGFGLPSLEALTVGTPVLASNTGAVPEVVSSPELLFDPRDPHSLAQKLRKLFEEPQTLANAVEQSRRGAIQLTWENTAKKALEALRGLASEASDVSPEKACSKSRHDVRRTISDTLRLNPNTPRTLALAEPREAAQPRLLIDATNICHLDHRTGIQRVVRQTIEHMTRDHPRNVHSMYTTPNSVLLDTGGRLSVPPEENSRVLRPRREDILLFLDSAWNEIVQQLPRIEEHRLRGGQVVFCVYDLVVLKAYGFCDAGMPPAFTRWFRYVLAYATGIVCISRAVADEVMDLLEAIDCPRRIDVGYWQLGADVPSAATARGGPARGPSGSADGDRAQTDDERRNHVKRHRPRFLMVGTMEPRKGYNVALDAFERLWENGDDVELCIVGKLGWMSDHTLERIENHKELGRRLFWYAGAGDDDLVMHYNRSAALISASYAEGFGLPLVEAGRYGKPVIASDLPVFREVAAGANGATFFEAGSSAALADAVRSFVKDGPQHAAGPDGGAGWPNWKESAEQLYTLLMEGNWYRTHAPQQSTEFRELSVIGTVEMTGPIPRENLQIEIDVIDGPIASPQSGMQDYLLKVRNPTTRVWSSHSAFGEDGRVHFTWKRIDPETFDTVQEGNRVAIPFVLAPGDTHYVRFSLPKDPDNNILRFDAVQEGMSWFTL